MNQMLVMAIMTGILLFMAAVGVLVDRQGAFAPEFLSVIPDTYRYYSIATVCLLCLLTSEMLFRKKINAVVPSLSLTEKLGAFRSAIIIRTAILEIAAFIMIVSALMWGDPNLNLAALMVIAAIFYRFPTTPGMASALKLNRQEQQELGVCHPL